MSNAASLVPGRRLQADVAPARRRDISRYFRDAVREKWTEAGAESDGLLNFHQ